MDPNKPRTVPSPVCCPRNRLAEPLNADVDVLAVADLVGTLIPLPVDVVLFLEVTEAVAEVPEARSGADALADEVGAGTVKLTPAVLQRFSVKAMVSVRQSEKILKR